MDDQVRGHVGRWVVIVHRLGGQIAGKLAELGVDYTVMEYTDGRRDYFRGGVDHIVSVVELSQQNREAVEQKLAELAKQAQAETGQVVH